MKLTFINIITAILGLVLTRPLEYECADNGNKIDSAETLNADAYLSLTTDGAWCWFSDPRAIYHEGKHRRTYAGWITSGGDIVVGYIDHRTGEVSSKVLYESLEVDDHDHPVILIDNQGYLNVFFSKHAKRFPIQLYKSTEPESIEEWAAPVSLPLNDMETYAGLRDSYTYQHPVYLSDEDRLYLFWRGADFKPNYSVSQDGGLTWSKGRILILPERIYKNRRPYLKVSSNGKDVIHFAFTDGHPNVEQENSIYYMYYKDGAFFKVTGERIKMLGEGPIAPGESGIVYDATEQGNPKSWVWDVAENKSGAPVIGYTKLHSDSVHIYVYACRVGNTWIHHELANSGGYFPEDTPGKDQREPEYSGGMSLDHEDARIVYLSVKRDAFFEIEKWTLKTRSGKWKITPLTQGSSRDNVRPFAVRNAGKQNHLQVLWMNLEYYGHFTDYRGAIKTNLFDEK